MYQRSKRQRGSALILVMGVLVLLSIIGTAFVLLMRIEVRASRNYVEDTRAQFLAQQALSYCLEHPTWDPNPKVEPPTGWEVDNDNMEGKESIYFTYPIADPKSDVHARFSILKKPFSGRLNVNWNSFYHQDPANPNDGFQALNEGSSTSEVSLEKAIEAYLNYLMDPAMYGNIFNGAQPSPFPGPPQEADARRVARELAARICTYRYGQSIGAPPTPPYPNAFPLSNFPGDDGVDDTQSLDDTTMAFEPPAPPAARALYETNTWIASDPAPSINWRPDPARDGVDNNGDGLVDETNPPGTPVEQIDEPQEFLQFFGLLPAPPWTNNNDTPFGSADLQAIINPAAGNPPLKAIVNDVFETWAPAQAAPPITGYGLGPAYFAWLAPLFTTYNRDYVGDKTPLNHLNLLVPPPPTILTENERAAIESDRTKFRNAMKAVFVAGEMKNTDAENTAWQVLANLVDFLDDDTLGGNPESIIGSLEQFSATEVRVNLLVKSEGWSAATDDMNSNGIPDPGEPNTRTFHGTERQPYFNEFYIYNRGSDLFDNDADGYVDNDPNKVPPDPAPPEVGRNGYYIELTNQYATPITLYNDPAAATDPKIDWYIRVRTPSLGEREKYRFSGAKAWDTVSQDWAVTGSLPISIPAGGYLVIENHDYAATDKALPAGSKALLHYTGPQYISLSNPAGAGNVPADAVLVNLDRDVAEETFLPGDTVQLVYSFTYDPDGAGPLAAVTDDAVVDAQPLPLAMTGTAGVVYNFAPSYERQDPRLERCVRAVAVGQPLLLRTLFAPAASGNDIIRNTLGGTNDDGNSANGVFDGNYDLGSSTGVGDRCPYDDFVEVPNNPAWKFGNVAALGNLLCVGPLPVDPPAYGWSSTDSWLADASPCTTVRGLPGAHRTWPLDAKKVNLIDARGADDDPAGRVSSLFDSFTTWCPWKDGKDNDGDWNAATDDLDGNGGPTPGEPHVDESDEVYVYGRVNVNEPTPEGNCAMSSLPFVVYEAPAANPTADDFDPSGLAVDHFYLTAVGTGSIRDIRDNLSEARFASRARFYSSVIAPAMISPRNFGRDTEDNHVYENGAGALRRDWRPQEWGTIQRPPRTETSFGAPPAGPAFDFILPGANGDGGDLLVDDKSEIEYTAGALLNEISLENELPQEFSQMTGSGLITYYITVDITDGRDVDGIDDDGDGTGVTDVDWKEGTVLAQKRIIALVNTVLPSTDPRRIRIFNWSTEGNYNVRQ